jgi:hypothetical protein
VPIVFGFTIQRRQMLEAELRRFADEMPTLGAERVILIGALARGSCGPDTELVLVVVQETDESAHRRGDFWTTHLRPRVGTHFLVYTPAELASLEDLDPVIQEAAVHGEVLIG